MIPASLRVATVLSVALTVLHLVVATAVAYQQPAEILGRQVREERGGEREGGRERGERVGERST